MNYKETMNELSKGHVFGKDPISLKLFQTYMNSKNNIQKQLKCIHISGTNGKGSTSYAMEQILMEAGYKTGVYSSPNIESDFDCIRINGKKISQERYESYIDLYFDEWKQYGLSSFEAEVFISFLYFIEEKVDFVIYEVGMGGKEDATNVIDSILSIITNIGLDHCDYLGNTYLEIAQKKAGIIKKNSLFITGEKRKDCLDWFSYICHQKHTKMYTAIKEDFYMDSGLHLNVLDYSNIYIPVYASYQSKNISLAIQALEVLKKENYIQFKKEDVYKGLSHFHWTGRFEIVRKDPLIILDGAHNLEGIKELVNSCKDIKNLSVLFSALKDKPYDDMLEELKKISSHIMVCDFEHNRKADVSLFLKHDVEVIDSYEKIIKEIQTPLLICGSLYFISQVRKKILL